MHVLHILVGILGSTSVFGGDPLFRKAHTLQNNDQETKVVCDALDKPKGTEAAKYKLGSMQKPMKYEDVLKLTVWNLKLNLRNGEKKLFADSAPIKWRRDILDEIIGILNIGCADQFVPKAITSVIKEFVMIYFNSLEKSVNNAAAWNNTLKVLKNCREKTKPLPVQGAGLLIESIKIGSSSVQLLPPEETADSILGLDIIIDAMWWMFSFSFGTCYSPAGYRSSWAPRYKKLFYEDFIVPFLKRWGNVGNAANFGVMFGNFDLNNVFQNLRICVTAAYTALGIADRQLVRPIKMGLQNIKTGEAIKDYK